MPAFSKVRVQMFNLCSVKYLLVLLRFQSVKIERHVLSLVSLFQFVSLLVL